MKGEFTYSTRQKSQRTESTTSLKCQEFFSEGPLEGARESRIAAVEGSGCGG